VPCPPVIVPFDTFHSYSSFESLVIPVTLAEKDITVPSWTTPPPLTAIAAHPNLSFCEKAGKLKIKAKIVAKKICFMRFLPVNFS